MSNLTTNYNLEKPLPNENYDIEVQNRNMDSIDTALKGKVSHSLATAVNDFIVGSGVGVFVKKTLAEIKTLLGLGSAAYKDYNVAGGVASYDTVDTHLSDYIRQPGYAITTGAANTYVATLSPAPISYLDGMGIVTKINVANAGASTINVNGLGAKSIVDSKGNAVISGKLRLNGTYSLKYNSTSGNFILQGEGGDLAKLPNLIKNGSFENGLNCWDTTSSYWAEISIKKFGTQSMAIAGTTSTAETLLNSAVIPYVQGHKYYVSCWVLSTTAGKGSQVYFPAVSTYPNSEINCTSAYTWYFNSFISADASIVTGNHILRLDNNNANIASNMCFDGVMVLDLTDAFGSGNEPSKAEMDAFVQANVGWWDSDLEALTADAVLDPNYMVVGQSGYDDGILKAGTMPNRGGVVMTPSGSAQTILYGYHDGGGTVAAVTVPVANVLTGTTIAGQAGTMVNRSVNAHTLAIETAQWQIGAGAINGGASNAQPVVFFKPPQGYYNGVTWVYQEQPDLQAANIISGKSIFGLAGSLKRTNGNINVTTAGLSDFAVNIGWKPSMVLLRTWDGMAVRVQMPYMTIGFNNPQPDGMTFTVTSLTDTGFTVTVTGVPYSQSIIFNADYYTNY